MLRTVLIGVGGNWEGYYSKVGQRKRRDTSKERVLERKEGHQEK